jgi:hypothetical protein
MNYELGNGLKMTLRQFYDALLSIKYIMTSISFKRYLKCENIKKNLIWDSAVSESSRFSRQNNSSLLEKKNISAPRQIRRVKALSMNPEGRGKKFLKKLA